MPSLCNKSSIFNAEMKTKVQKKPTMTLIDSSIKKEIIFPRIHRLSCLDFFNPNKGCQFNDAQTLKICRTV